MGEKWCYSKVGFYVPSGLMVDQNGQKLQMSSPRQNLSLKQENHLLPLIKQDKWFSNFSTLLRLTNMGFPVGSDGKESACNVDVGQIPASGRSSGEGNGNPPQYSCLENFMDRGAWQATVHGVTELDMTKQLTLLTRYLYI